MYKPSLQAAGAEGVAARWHSKSLLSEIKGCLSENKKNSGAKKCLSRLRVPND